MIEVEAKVALNSSKAKAIRTTLIQKYGKPTQSIKRDFYLSANQSYFLRIRETDKTRTLDLKGRAMTKGMETNDEMSWKVTSAKKALNWLKTIGIEPTISKMKKTEKFQVGAFTIELNYIHPLGHFLEIEQLVESKKHLFQAKKAIKNAFESLGFKPSEFEKKPYYDLMRHSSL
ncbi:class IV adenylate cyclase [Candidatus Peregrinibacteria bacterium]|nr:MAG: class IV adenylate cyclase [Candidatus Peregrinibacteria bacterium]